MQNKAEQKNSPNAKLHSKMKNMKSLSFRTMISDKMKWNM